MVHTANDEPDAVLSYIDAGADGCVGKAPKGGTTTVLGQIAAAFRRRGQRSSSSAGMRQRPAGGTGVS